MSRRGTRPSQPPGGRSTGRAIPPGDPRPGLDISATTEDDPEAFGERLAETLRKLALGLLAALATARAYWPSEIERNQVSGSGLTWSLAILLVGGLWVAVSLIGGRFRFRWSWTDVAVVALMLLVGLSSVQGIEHRLAINLAWEWAALCLAYLLARNLPRARAESTILAGAIVATAVAVSVYGLYQARVEIPQLQERFRRDPQQVLREANLPADAKQIRAFADRIGGREIFATFGLANSLACFLVGPLVLALGVVAANLASHQAQRGVWSALSQAALPLLCLLLCLLLTKSFSAWIGLLAGVLVVAWSVRGAMPRRLLLGTGLAGIALVFVLVVASSLSGRLDWGLLTQAGRSLRYRWEYWKGTWGVISEGAATLSQAVGKTTFWSGVGPGNFGPYYLLHKLPWSSEEILDPHNLFLEVWVTAGFWAVLALVLALALALWNLLGRSTAPEMARPEAGTASQDTRKRPGMVSRETSTSPPSGPSGGAASGLSWLVLSGAMGLVLVFLVGQFNPFQNDLLVRWLVLAVSWAMAFILGRALWRRIPLPPFTFGAGVLAMAVDLLAAGGIGYQSVALVLWLLIALGLNLREDRGCARLREVESRIPGFAMGLIWAGLAGSFLGATIPYWRCESAVARADEALAHQPPNFEQAQAAYEFAERADVYNPRPWLGDAYLQLLAWNARGSRPEDLRWKKVPALILMATSPPRNPNVWSLHSERARITQDLLAQVGPSLTPKESIVLRGSVVEASRKASLLYPTNATLHARLAQANAAIQMYQDAAAEADEALRLDALTPHADKKLPDRTREQLLASLSEWKQKAEHFKLTPP